MNKPTLVVYSFKHRDGLSLDINILNVLQSSIPDILYFMRSFNGGWWNRLASDNKTRMTPAGDNRWNIELVLVFPTVVLNITEVYIFMNQLQYKIAD